MMEQSNSASSKVSTGSGYRTREEYQILRSRAHSPLVAVGLSERARRAEADLGAILVGLLVPPRRRCLTEAVGDHPLPLAVQRVALVDWAVSTTHHNYRKDTDNADKLTLRLLVCQDVSDVRILSV
jgi:hypothetical protein